MKRQYEATYGIGILWDLYKGCFDTGLILAITLVIVILRIDDTKIND